MCDLEQLSKIQSQILLCKDNDIAMAQYIQSYIHIIIIMSVIEKVGVMHAWDFTLVVSVN